MPRVACLVLTILAAGAVHADDAPPASSRAGALVFFASQDRAALTMPIGELRAGVEDRVDAALAATGKTVVPSREIVARAGAARVRSATVLPPVFLNELRGAVGLDQLTLVEVVLAADRVFLLARTVSTADGRVVGVWVAEAPLAPADAAGAAASLLRGLDAVCRVLAAPAADPAAGSPDLILPTHPVGCTPEEALLATYALLRQARVVAGRDVLDPAIARAALMADGLDPDRLDAAGRSLLAARFGARVVLRSTLMSADVAPAAASRRAVEDAGPTPASPMLRDYSFTLFAVAIEDGHLVAVADHHHAQPAAAGLFGRPRRGSPLADIVASAATTWTSLQSSRGDL